MSTTTTETSTDVFPSFESFIKHDEIEQKIAASKNVPIPIVLSPPSSLNGMNNAIDASTFILKYNAEYRN